MKQDHDQQGQLPYTAEQIVELIRASSFKDALQLLETYGAFRASEARVHAVNETFNRIDESLAALSRHDGQDA